MKLTGLLETPMSTISPGYKRQKDWIRLMPCTLVPLTIMFELVKLGVRVRMWGCVGERSRRKVIWRRDKFTVALMVSRGRMEGGLFKTQEHEIISWQLLVGNVPLLCLIYPVKIIYHDFRGKFGLSKDSRIQPNDTVHFQSAVQTWIVKMFQVSLFSFKTLTLTCRAGWLLPVVYSRKTPSISCFTRHKCTPLCSWKLTWVVVQPFRDRMTEAAAHPHTLQEETVLQAGII